MVLKSHVAIAYVIRFIPSFVAWVSWSNLSSDAPALKSILQKSEPVLLPIIILKVLSICALNFEFRAVLYCANYLQFKR